MINCTQKKTLRQNHYSPKYTVLPRNEGLPWRPREAFLFYKNPTLLGNDLHCNTEGIECIPSTYSPLYPYTNCYLHVPFDSWTKYFPAYLVLSILQIWRIYIFFHGCATNFSHQFGHDNLILFIYVRMYMLRGMGGAVHGSCVMQLSGGYRYIWAQLR